MPVHRIPGGARGSVYALTEELDAWLARSREDAEPGAAAEPNPMAGANLPPATPARAGWMRALRALAQGGWGIRPAAAAPPVLLLGLAAFAWQGPGRDDAAAALPQDRQAAALFLEARSDWAQRNPRAIGAAIAKLRQVVAREPGFAPAHAALADGYVLAHEFGAMRAAEAYGRGQDAVDAALRIDPNNAAAWRAKGFLDYWWRRDPEAAQASFTRALRAQPDHAQTHFWYGNVLIDNGDFEAGLAELDKARLLDPVSAALQADYAWALWAAGQEARGVGLLESLRARHPDLATVRDYLAVAYLAEGRIADFITETAALAAIRDDAEDVAEAEALREALPGGEAAVLRLFVSQTMADFARGDRKTVVWPIYVAAMANDRGELLRLLKIAAARKEVWGSAGLVRQIARRREGDAAVMALVAPWRPPPMVPKPG